MGLPLLSPSVKLGVGHQSVRLKCRTLTRQRAHARKKAPLNSLMSPKCPSCMTDDSCARVDVREQKWGYFGLQWPTLDQYRVSIVSKGFAPSVSQHMEHTCKIFSTWFLLLIPSNVFQTVNSPGQPQVLGVGVGKSNGLQEPPTINLGCCLTRHLLSKTWNREEKEKNRMRLPSGLGKGSTYIQRDFVQACHFGSTLLQMTASSAGYRGNEPERKAGARTFKNHLSLTPSCTAVSYYTCLLQAHWL